MSQAINAVIAELMDRRLLNDVDDDLHREIAVALIKAAKPAFEPTEEKVTAGAKAMVEADTADGPSYETLARACLRAGVPVLDESEDDTQPSDSDLAVIDQAWENHKAALPVATVINDNQPGRTAIIEITIDPPTLPVGTKLYAEPKVAALGREDKIGAARQCTCHPSDNPPVPCAQKFAYSECVAEPKSQEPDAVAWQYQRADGKWCDCWKPNEIELKVAAKRFRPLYTHPTTKPEAQAVGVDVIEAGQFDCREFCEDAFRSMEVQICGDTRTVQFGVSDHGGDHPTMPCCAISWTDAADLASWIQSCIAPVSVDAESIHQLIYKDTHNALEGLVPDTFLSGELWIATQAGGR